MWQEESKLSELTTQIAVIVREASGLMTNKKLRETVEQKGNNSNYVTEADKAVQDFIENAKADLEMEELTPKLLKLFISRIEVYEKPEKHSKTCGNDVVIHYSFHSMHQPMPVLTPSKNRTFTQAAC